MSGLPRRARGGKSALHPSWRLGSLVLLMAAPLGLTPTGCTGDGLIGGECADGYDFCDETCIPVTEDEANCGSCNNACRRNLACLEGLCGGPDGDTTVDELGGAGGMGGEGGNGDGGINVGAGGPGGTGGKGGSGASGSGATGGGNPGTGGGAPECLPPFDSAAACGDCDTQCTGSTPNCSPDGDGGFECVANCLEDPFITECSGECVDVQTNPSHCGTCSNQCPSGICVDGACVGARSGHMIAMCMNYRSQSSQQAKLLSNAVFLANANPVRVYAYVKDTGGAIENGTDFALTQAASSLGRDLELTKFSDPDELESELRQTRYDMFLIYDQNGAAEDELAEVGASWAMTVETYARTGGVVVALTGGTGTDEMPQLMTELGMFQVSGTSPYQGERIYVQAPGDAVGINVLSPFLGVASTCVFETSETSGGALVFVTSDTEPDDGVGKPNVVHRTVVD